MLMGRGVLADEACVTTTDRVTSYHSRVSRKLAWAVCGVMALMWIGSIVWMALTSLLAGAIWLAVCALFQWWFTVAMVGMGAYVRDDELLVRTNMARRIHVRWADIEGFEIGEAHAAFQSYPVVVARLRSGRTVQIPGTSSSWEPDYCDRVIAGLQAELAARLHTPTEHRAQPAQQIPHRRRMSRNAITATVATTLAFVAISGTGLILEINDNPLAPAFTAGGLVILCTFHWLSRRRPTKHRSPEKEMDKRPPT